MSRFSSRFYSRLAVPCFAFALVASLAASGQDLRISIPKRTKPTPIQKYNREGVKELKKNKIEDAKKLFYKAYLIDPNDPFTLNNLGYIAELEGEIDRAQRYYDLASQFKSDAVVDRATMKAVEGKKVTEVAGKTEGSGLEINQLNVQAMGLLLKDRALEADTVLTKALNMDRNNPFTLNNLGYAKEKQGELEQALGYYTAAARAGSQEKIVVAANRKWRGEPISEVASRNAESVRKQMQEETSIEARVARLNLRGVSALNRNDRRAAREHFENAYQLDDNNAFALNNMGYIAELDGDRETAMFYYDKAQLAERAGETVGVATNREAEGRALTEVAGTNTTFTEARMEAETAARRRQNTGQPATLKQRGQ